MESVRYDGTLNAARVSLNALESGDYHIWLEATNGRSPATRIHVPGWIRVEQPWSAEWTAALETTPGFRNVALTWRTYPGPDIDTYRVRITPPRATNDGENGSTSEGANGAKRLIDVGLQRTLLVEGLTPNQAYYITVLAVDEEGTRIAVVENRLYGNGITIDSVQPTRGARMNSSPTAFRCNLGSMVRGEHAAIYMTAWTDAALAENRVLRNVATVRTESSEALLTNNRHTTTLIARTDADLAVRMADEVDPVRVGDVVHYTVAVDNLGPASATQITLRNTLLDGTSLLAATPSQGACSVAGTAPTCALGDLAAGGTVSPPVESAIGAESSEQVTHKATVDAAQRDPMRSNNLATETTGVLQSADLAVTMEAAPMQPIAGADVAYTVRVTHHGPSTASHVELTSILPPGVTVAQALATPTGACRFDGPCVHCALEEIESGGSSTTTIMAHVYMDTSGVLYSMQASRGVYPIYLPFTER